MNVNVKFRDPNRKSKYEFKINIKFSELLKELYKKNLSLRKENMILFVILNSYIQIKK